MSLLAFMLARQPVFTEQQPGGGADTYGDAIAAISGLISWWRFGEAAGADIAVDEQGVQNGLYQASVSLNHAALMEDTGNTAMRLDGISGFVDIADQAAFHLATGTMALWFQPDSLASDRYLLSKSAGGIVQGDMELNYRAADNTFRFSIDDSTTVQRATSGGVLPTGVLQVGAIYCVVIQWGTGGMKLHLAVAGARSLIGTNAYTGGFTTNTRSLRVGASQFSGAPGQFFDGGIDDLMMWNRQLSNAELDVVVQAAAAPTEPGLIDFVNNNSTIYYSIPHVDALDFPAGVGAWGFWTRVDDNAGTASQFALSAGVDTAIPALGIYLAESGNTGTTPNALGFFIKDNAGVGGTTLRTSSVVTGADGVQRLVVVQSTGSLVQMWLCSRDGTATKVYEAALALGALVPAIEWNFGRRSDGNTARYWEEWLGGLFKSNIALSQAQIEDIATGLAPTTVLGADCAAFWRFQDGGVATELDVVSGVAATRRDASVGGGIAANYIQDVGIANHASVLFHETFESGNFSAGGWTMFPSTNASITTTAANVHTGTRAADLVCPIRTDSGGELSKTLSTSWPRDHLYLRCYIRFDPGWNLGTQKNNHCGLSVRTFGAQPGTSPPSGTDYYGATSQPTERNLSGQAVYPAAGIAEHYIFHMDQSGQFGTLRQSLTNPSFVPGTWHHFEHMLKANDVGVANGEIASWIDGVLVNHTTGLRFRTTASLLPDRIWLRNYIHNNTVRINHIYFDNIVLATEYVGPMRMS